MIDHWLGSEKSSWASAWELQVFPALLFLNIGMEMGKAWHWIKILWLKIFF